MPGSKSGYLEKAFLNAALGGVSFPSPAIVYFALYTTGTLTDGSTGSAPGAVEVSGGGYARAALTNNATNFPDATGLAPSEKRNALIITFPTATADWGTVTQWAVLDAASGGNILYFGDFDVPKQVLAGDTAVLPANAVLVTET